jgi:hypothetical protein
LLIQRLRVASFVGWGFDEATAVVLHPKYSLTGRMDRVLQLENQNVHKSIAAIEALCFKSRGFCFNLAEAFSSINVNCTCDAFGYDGGNDSRGCVATVQCFPEKLIRVRTFMGGFRTIPAGKDHISIVLLLVRGS